MQEQHIPVPHRLTLSDRKSLTATGVTEVDSFDEDSVVLSTSLGTLTIQGSDLKLKNLSLESGQALVEGQISSLSYEEPRASGGFWRRLLG